MADDQPYRELVDTYGHELDLGAGNSLRWFTDQSGMVVGAIREHLKANRAHCSSAVFFGGPSVEAWRRNGKPIHKVVAWHPLTLTPSLLCRACGSHGFVTDGAWIPA